MADVKLTAAQQAVVDHTGSALLVSAAAGSGKTKVLVDRVLRRVCDADHPCNIDEFLIITFSEAAASEMRTKIMQALAKLQAEQPENRHLQRQSARICAAQISTVHAFCSAALRKYCHLANLPADFRVCEAEEAASMLSDALEDVLVECYETIDTDPEFAAFVDRLGFGRDDKNAAELVKKVYESVRCREDSEKWMQDCETACDLENVHSFSETPWGEYLLSEMQELLSSVIRIMRQALQMTESDPVMNEKNAPVFEANIAAIESVKQMTDWDAVVAESQGIKFASLKSAKNEDKALKEEVKNKNDYAKELYKKAMAPFYASSEAVLAQARECAPAIHGLFKVVRLLDARYTQEKRRRKMLDFSDLEHEMIRLIYDREKQRPTPCAAEIGKAYREIMVDEYQDSNAVQERIFKTLSDGEKNRFMVGDVKQSIYRFRKAEPSIFIKKYEEYEQRTENNSEKPRRILLSENFRSRPEILSCVNDVFSLIMSRKTGEIDYTEQEALKNGRPFPELPQNKIELHCIAADGAAEEDEQKASERAATEAEFVAARIERLLAEKTPVTENDTVRPCRAEDIAIILRSPGSTAHYYRAALTRRGIPWTCDRSEDILKTSEIETLFSILQIVENPLQDIPLLSAMASPVFAFSPEELAQPRTEQRKTCYYDCLTESTQKSEKLERFLSWLEKTRTEARQLGIRALLDYILKTTDLASVFGALEDGQTRRDNIAQFLSFAEAYEQRNGASLGRFTRMVCRLMEENKSIEQSSASRSGHAVQIVSIHHSKGLEYPIVILADLAKQFNREESKQLVMLDDTLFIGTYSVDPVLKTKCNNACRQAIVQKQNRLNISEEMRNLYVAMTRAKDMLIMTFCKSKLESRLKKLSGSLTVPLDPQIAASVDGLGDWILLAALCRTESGELFRLAGSNPYSAVRDDPWVVRVYEDLGSTAEAKLRAGEEEKLLAQKESLPTVWDESVYPYRSACTVASKITATQLKGRNIDAEAAEQTEQSAVSPWRKLTFAPKTALTGAEKGNATHLFMQFVRYENCLTCEGIEQEKGRLVSKQFLSEKQAEAVDTEAILALFSSPFGKMILSAEQVRREFKFSLFVDAGEYCKEAAGEQVMLQGVVDCFWQDEDGLVIVDYKTDRLYNGAAERTAYYAPQVRAYAKALSKIYEMPVKAAYLYFFDGGRCERVTI